MNNKLLKTNSIWYKIRKIFRTIFKKKTELIVDKSTSNIHTENNKKEFLDNIMIEQLTNEDYIMAQKLLNNDIDMDDLTDEEIIKITEYFNRKTEEKEKELSRIKEHIIEMKNKVPKKHS